MNRPLTARHLVIILLVIGFGAWWFLNVRHTERAMQRSNQITDCVLRAPAGWNCDAYPSYPGRQWEPQP